MIPDVESLQVGHVGQSSFIELQRLENHASNPNVEWMALVPYCGLALFLASIYWVLYVGLEPVVRRRWPDSLISWNRLLAGRFRDPRVGRDLLLGLAAGAVMLGIEAMRRLFPGWLGLPPVEPARVQLDSLDGFAHAAALFLNAQTDIVFLPMAVLFLLILFRMILRERRVAAAAPVVLLALLSSSGNEYPWIALIANVLQMVILLGVLLELQKITAGSGEIRYKDKQELITSINSQVEALLDSKQKMKYDVLEKDWWSAVNSEESD